MSNFLWPHGLYSPWNSPSQNTGVGSLSLLQESTLCLLHCRQILYQLSYQGSSIILQNSIIQLLFKQTLPLHLAPSIPGASLKAQLIKNPPAMGSIPELGWSPGEGKGYPLQYSGLENSMDLIVHGSQRVRHYWVTFTFIYYVKKLGSVKTHFYHCCILNMNRFNKQMLLIHT